jgi:hypothetical protein
VCLIWTIFVEAKISIVSIVFFRKKRTKLCLKSKRL